MTLGRGFGGGGGSGGVRPCAAVAAVAAAASKLTFSCCSTYEYNKDMSTEAAEHCRCRTNVLTHLYTPY